MPEKRGGVVIGWDKIKHSMDIPKEVVVAMIAAIPGLAAPLFSSLLQKRGLAQRTKEVEMLEKRVQVIERLLMLEKHLSDERKKMLQIELADIVQDMVADRVRERAAGGTVVERLPMLHRVFLVYQQPTTRASVYRGFFWVLISIGIFTPFSAIAVAFSEEVTANDLPYLLIVYIGGSLFYVMLGLVFRSAALRQQKQAQAAAERTVTSVPGR